MAMDPDTSEEEGEEGHATLGVVDFTVLQQESNNSLDLPLEIIIRGHFSSFFLNPMFQF